MNIGIPLILVLIVAVCIVVAVHRRRSASTTQDAKRYSDNEQTIKVARSIELERQEAELRRRDATGAAPLLAADASTQEFVVVDVETTGLDASRHQITQIAAKRYKNLREEESEMIWDCEQFAAYCRLRPRSRIPMEIQSLTGITADLLRREGRPLEDVIGELHLFIGTSLVVAHNAEFDLRFLQAAAAQVGLKFTGNFLCTLKLSRDAWPNRKSYKLVHLAEYIGADSSGAHNAVRDIEMTFAVLMAAMRAMGKLRRVTV